MCTVVLLRRPGHAWPLILGANRDEMLNRPWLPPARHWPDRPDVVAGKDELAGGAWMGVNDAGVVACILNRHGSLGPASGKRSRGELVLEALDHADAADAADALSEIDGRAYRPFNMIIADNRDAWWIALTEDIARNGSPLRVTAVPNGFSMITAGALNDRAEPRIGTFLPRFERAPPPDPDRDDWMAWEKLLGAHGGRGSMSFRLESGFGTSSASLLALPSVKRAFGAPPAKPVWRFAAGAPESVPFLPVDLG
jgi:hypothetical protein